MAGKKRKCSPSLIVGATLLWLIGLTPHQRVDLFEQNVILHTDFDECNKRLGADLIAAIKAGIKDPDHQKTVEARLDAIPRLSYLGAPHASAKGYPQVRCLPHVLMGRGVDGDGSGPPGFRWISYALLSGSNVLAYIRAPIAHHAVPCCAPPTHPCSSVPMAAASRSGATPWPGCCC